MATRDSRTPLRVALLCHYPDDADAPAGGVWAVGRNLAAGLVSAGAQVHVIRYLPVGGSQDPAVRVTGRSPLFIHSIEIPRRSRLPLRRVAAVPLLQRELDAVRPDAITAHESEYGLAALRSGYPAAVTIHGIPRQEFRSYSDWKRRLDLGLTIWQDWIMVRKARHIVAINNYAMAQYRRRTRAQFHRIDVPIGDVFFDVPVRDPDPHALLMVGGMSERKDPLTLLRALSMLRLRVPGVRLRIAGRQPSGDFKIKVDRFIRDNGLEDSVQFIGSLNQPELALAYTANAITVMSSRQETSPAVLMEAMAARRPVVASEVGGVAEIVAQGETGFTTSAGDAASMALRLEELLNDPERAAAMGMRGREVAESRYRRGRVGEAYVRLLSHLAATW
ncbi:MAG: glycosyltransferase family 4 protein [Chloroflexota bacterium]|nr:glycosyltransferase family 4 protein [Chloroflexota bacterium]